MEKTLTEIFAEIGHFGEDIGCNDKGGTHSYLETYEKELAPFRNKYNFMELGMAMGDSMKLWGEYFGKDCNIVGVDLSVIFDLKDFDKRFRFIACDCTKPDLLDHIKDLTFDVIIDDGSHMENDQVNTFNILKHKMNSGGVYIIEDILALDHNRKRFENLHSNCEIIDLRKVKGRFDDVLIIYRF